MTDTATRSLSLISDAPTDGTASPHASTSHSYSTSSLPRSHEPSGHGSPHIAARKRQKTFHIPQAYHSVIAGGGAGIVSSVATCPLDVIKTRLQAQSTKSGTSEYEGVFKTVTRIFRQSGVKGLYRGLGPTMMGYLPTWGIYFTVYDWVKQQLGASKLGGKKNNGSDTWGVHIVAAMTAGATGTIATNPLWVIKTRFMAQAIQDDSGHRRYRHTWDAVRTIYRHEGVRAFYKGLAPSLIGVSHVAVQFPLYEQLKIWAAPEDRSPLQSRTILLCSALSKMVASLATYPHEVLRTRLQIHRSQAGLASQAAAAAAASRGAGEVLGAVSEPVVQPPTAASSTARSLIGEFKSILRQDGWRGFYRGLSINLVRTVPNSAVTMLTYELIMRKLTV